MGSLATFITKLRELFLNDDRKKYYLSAALQCPRPDIHIPLASMQSSIDFIWIQFYNNPSCNLDTVEGMDVEAWPRRASRSCLIGNAVRQRMVCTKKTRNGLWDSAT
jgi:hypothetical protein